MPRVCFLLLALLVAAGTAASQTPSAETGSHQDFGGIWVLNRDLGDVPGVPALPNNFEGRGGRRGLGGRGGGRGPGDAQVPEENLARQQAIMNHVRTFMESPRQLTFVIRDSSVGITDSDGRVLALPTDDKRVSARAENGLVRLTRRNRWDGDTLRSDLDIENGPVVARSYALSPGGTQLRITTTISFLRGGQPVMLTRVYERPVEPQ